MKAEENAPETDEQALSMLADAKKNDKLSQLAQQLYVINRHPDFNTDRMLTIEQAYQASLSLFSKSQAEL